MNPSLECTNIYERAVDLSQVQVASPFTVYVDSHAAFIKQVTETYTVPITVTVLSRSPRRVPAPTISSRRTYMVNTEM